MASRPASRRRKACAPYLIKVQTWDRDGRLLHEGDMVLECPDRESAVEAINLRLKQFDQAGYDLEDDYWWGKSLREPCQQTRFMMR